MGRGNYGISRMNKRIRQSVLSCRFARRDASPGAWFLPRPPHALSSARNSLCGVKRRRVGHGERKKRQPLLWTIPWSGRPGETVPDLEAPSPCSSRSAGGFDWNWTKTMLSTLGAPTRKNHAS